METIILALETSTNACSAALIIGERHFARFEETQKAHTQLLLPMIDDLLGEAHIQRQDISVIAVGRGPGSFTGVRIAVSAAQGLGFGLNIPVYPISTLQALAYQAIHDPSILDDSIIISAIDARMHEVYSGIYHLQHKTVALCQDEFLCAPHVLLDSILTNKQNIVAIGSGWDAYFAEIMSKHTTPVHFIANKHPQAIHIGLLAKLQIQQGFAGMKAEEVHPVYIRDNVAQKSTSTQFI